MPNWEIGQMRLKTMFIIPMSLMALIAGLTLSSDSGAAVQTAASTPQTSPIGPSGQGAGAAASMVLVPQCQTVVETVNAVECVQVPTTVMETRYRMECRTETVPITHFVSEVVNEPRTFTCWEPVQETVLKPVTHFVCEPTTVMQRRFHYYPVTRQVQRTYYQAQCSRVIVDKVVTQLVPECVTETVPVTRMRVETEQETRIVTQQVPVRTMVPVVTCAHQCGHQCGSGCGYCGGVTTCVTYQPLTTYVSQEVPVTRCVPKFIPETTYVQRNRTKYTPVRQVVQVPEIKIDKIPIPVTQCVTEMQGVPYDVPVTRMVFRPVVEQIPVCVTKMVPHSNTVIVPTVKCRPVVETTTREVQVCVPYQVPVTVMTTQSRVVSHQVPVTRQVMVPLAAPAAAPSTQAGH
jgi:hypothetical protein